MDCCRITRRRLGRDGGHSFAHGSLPKTAKTDPTTIAQQTPDSTKAPARTSYRSDGRIYSLTELSYVYDPFQWDPFATAPNSTSTVDSLWQSTWKNNFKNFPNAVATDDGNYGSTQLLSDRKRPEHKSFDQAGTRAWQLLDIFSTGNPADSSSAGAISNQISTRGRINVNTASREALRTLGAGIKFANDQAIQPGTVYGPQTSAAADAFADNVIAQRQTQPFISTSQLAALPGSAAVIANLTPTMEPFFGNPDQWPSSGPSKQSDGSYWNDAAKVRSISPRSTISRLFVAGTSECL